MDTSEKFTPTTPKDLARENFNNPRRQDHGTSRTNTGYRGPKRDIEEWRNNPLSTNERKAANIGYDDYDTHLENMSDPAPDESVEILQEYIDELHEQALIINEARDALIVSLEERMAQDDPEFAEELGIDPDPWGSAHLGYATDWDMEDQLRARGLVLKKRPVDVIRDFDGNAGNGELLDASPLTGFSVKNRP